MEWMRADSAVAGRTKEFSADEWQKWVGIFRVAGMCRLRLTENDIFYAYMAYQSKLD